MTIVNGFNFMDLRGFNIPLGDSHAALGIGIGIMILGLVLSVLFCLSLFMTMQRVPKANRVFPSWFAWLLLIPGAGIIFQWMMLPFGIPNSIKNTASSNKTLSNCTRTLFAFGLVHVISATLLSSKHALELIVSTGNAVTIHIKGLLGIVCLVFWVLYWIKVGSIRRKYLS